MTRFSKFQIGSKSGTKPTAFTPNIQLRQTPLRALVVDDTIIDRTVHTKFLKKNKFEVVQAINGRHAVELHLAGKNFDLILIDDHMPGMHGDETVRTLRALGVKSVIIGMGFEENREAVMNAGANEFVIKPWLEMEDLLSEFNLIV